LQTTFSQLLFMFIKLGFEIFELWLNIFKFQVKFFELPIELGLDIQTSSQALGTWTQAFGQGGSSFEFSLFLVECHWPIWAPYNISEIPKQKKSYLSLRQHTNNKIFGLDTCLNSHELLSMDWSLHKRGNEAKCLEYDFTAIAFKVVSAMQKISTYKISMMWGKDLNLFVEGHAKHGEDNVKFSFF
jgi:hypothetical protein